MGGGSTNISTGVGIGVAETDSVLLELADSSAATKKAIKGVGYEKTGV